jgi:hypothetical protein
MKSPLGFPINPDKWTVEVSNTSLCQKTSPVNGTWYGDTGLSPTGPSIVIPIGCWRVMYEATLGVNNSSSDIGLEAYITLSNANNTLSDNTMSGFTYTSDAAAAGKGSYHTVHRERILILSSKSTRYLNIMVDSGGSSLILDGTVTTTIIRAICAYL